MRAWYPRRAQAFREPGRPRPLCGSGDRPPRGAAGRWILATPPHIGRATNRDQSAVRSLDRWLRARRSSFSFEMNRWTDYRSIRFRVQVPRPAFLTKT